MIKSVRRRKRSLGPVLMALVLGNLLATRAEAWQQRPATPCPCTVDGSCQPNGPWGYSGTKWRPWPGDVVGAAPATAEEEETREQLQLDPFELPLPQKENERGPNTSKRASAPRPTADAAQPDVEVNEAPEPALPLPDVGPLEGAQPERGFELPDDLDLNPPADERPADAPQPQPPLRRPQAPPEQQQPAEPQDDFDPFSSLDGPPAAPAEVIRRASAQSPNQEDAPPALPASLRKVSQSLSAPRRSNVTESRYVQSAVLVQ